MDLHALMSTHTRRGANTTRAGLESSPARPLRTMADSLRFCAYISISETKEPANTKISIKTTTTSALSNLSSDSGLVNIAAPEGYFPRLFRRCCPPEAFPAVVVRAVNGFTQGELF